MLRSVDFEDVVKDFGLAKLRKKLLFELCTALQLQMCAKGM